MISALYNNNNRRRKEEEEKIRKKRIRESNARLMIIIGNANGENAHD